MNSFTSPFLPFMRSVSIMTGLLFCGLAAATQTPVADSFLLIASRSAVDTVQIDAYREAAVELSEADPAKAVSLAGISMEKARKRKDLFREAQACKTIGVAYDINGNMDSCLYFLHAAYRIFTELKNEEWQSHVQSDIGIAYYYRGNYELALRNQLAALKIRRQTGNKVYISRTLNNIGLVYRARKDYANAIKSYQESLVIKKELQDRQGILNTMMNIGALYQNEFKYDSALVYGKLALQRAEELHAVSDIAAAQGNIGGCLVNLKRPDEALLYLEAAEKSSLENNFTGNLIAIYEALGDLYVNKKNPVLAESYFFKGLQVSKNKQRKEPQKVFNKKLAGNYFSMGKYQLAYERQQAADSIADEMLNEENLRQMNEMTQVYQSAEKEKEILALNLQGESDKKLITKSRNERNYFIGAALLFLALAFLAWNAFVQNKRKKEKLDEQNRVIEKSLAEKEVLMKEIHHRVKNNLQIVSSLLDLQSISIRDAQAAEAVKEGKNRVQSMALIHQNLYSEDNLKGIRAGQYIGNLLKSLSDSYNITDDKVKIVQHIEDLNLDVDTMIPLGLVLNELITNSFKYAFVNNPEGVLEIELTQREKAIFLRVKDNGAGFPPGLETGAVRSFGLRMIRAFAQKLKATLEIKNDQGAVVEMLITKFSMA